MQQKPGFYHLAWRGQGDGRIVIFSCKCLVHCMGFVLEQISDRVFCMDSSLEFRHTLQPLHSIPELGSVPTDCAVYRLKFSHQKDDDDRRRLFFRVEEAHPVVFVPQERRARAVGEQVAASSEACSSSDGSCSERSVGEDEFNGFELGSSDADSVASSVDSGADDVLEEEDVGKISESEESSDDEQGISARASPGTHVVERNGYWTIINDPKYPDIKVKVHNRWCTPDNCGVKAKSKTIVLWHFGEDSTCPTKCLLVLRSWVLMRLQQNNFMEKKSARRKWLACEAERLRKDILALGVTSGGTGHELADTMVRQWTPEALS